MTTLVKESPISTVFQKAAHFMGGVGNAPVFVVAYLLFMLPTYVLPYFGSNSMLAHAVGAMLGLGPTPQWWMHAWALGMLMNIAWARGGYVGRGYLVIFPVLATVFDLFPVINNIPLVPTIMHVMALILGVKATPEAPLSSVDNAVGKASKSVVIITVVAVIGIAMFATSTVLRAGKVRDARNERAPATETEKKTTADHSSKTAPLAEDAKKPAVALAEQPAVAKAAPPSPGTLSATSAVVSAPTPAPVTQAPVFPAAPSTPPPVIIPSPPITVSAAPPPKPVAPRKHVPAAPAEADPQRERDRALLNKANKTLDDLLK